MHRDKQHTGPQISAERFSVSWTWETGTGFQYEQDRLESFKCIWLDLYGYNLFWESLALLETSARWCQKCKYGSRIFLLYHFCKMPNFSRLESEAFSV